MGKFDYIIDNISARISAAQDTRRDRAANVSTTAENMFHDVGSVVLELQPVLAKKFPDIKPSVSLGSWIETKDGATNTLKLKSATAEKEIKLGLVFGQGNVSVEGKTIPGHESLSVLATEIALFFSEQ